MENYLDINRKLWNDRLDSHVNSEFYDNLSFIQGRSSLNEIELKLLGDVRGKKILHLQCHFGQDTMSLARMGAEVTGVDLSDKAIDYANSLAKELKINASFICSNILSLEDNLSDEFDIVFTSYGTIGWLPDINKWAAIVERFLKPGGKFIFADFHPVVWMFDDNFSKITYPYKKAEPIIEDENGSYADTTTGIQAKSICWNHALSEVIDSLLNKGLQLDSFLEYDYSPYNCFKDMDEFEKGKYRLKTFGNKLPMVYSLLMTK